MSEAMLAIALGEVSRFQDIIIPTYNITEPCQRSHRTGCSGRSPRIRCDEWNLPEYITFRTHLPDGLEGIYMV